MKKGVVFVIAAFMMSATGLAFSQQTNEEKVICELASRNCLNQSEIIQQRVKKLNKEIKKGTKTYSAEELKKLEQKLKEAQDILDKLEGKAPGK